MQRLLKAEASNDTCCCSPAVPCSASSLPLLFLLVNHKVCFLKFLQRLLSPTLQLPDFWSHPPSISDLYHQTSNQDSSWKSSRTSSDLPLTLNQQDYYNKNILVWLPEGSKASMLQLAYVNQHMLLPSPSLPQTEQNTTEQCWNANYPEESLGTWRKHKDLAVWMHSNVSSCKLKQHSRTHVRKRLLKKNLLSLVNSGNDAITSGSQDTLRPQVLF